jgi:hypothetical protein
MYIMGVTLFVPVFYIINGIFMEFLFFTLFVRFNFTLILHEFYIICYCRATGHEHLDDLAWQHVML